MTRSFLAGDDYIIKTSPVFPIDGTVLYYESNTTETASSQTETDSIEMFMSTPSILELSKNETQLEETSATTESVTTITMSTETDETMTPLERFTTTSYGTEKPIETTLESDSETEATKQVPKIYNFVFWSKLFQDLKKIIF